MSINTLCLHFLHCHVCPVFFFVTISTASAISVKQHGHGCFPDLYSAAHFAYLFSFIINP